MRMGVTQVGRTDVGTSAWLRAPAEGLVMENYLVGARALQGWHEKILIHLDHRDRPHGLPPELKSVHDVRGNFTCTRGPHTKGANDMPFSAHCRGLGMVVVSNQQHE
jgi:hypothetical protein